LKGSSGVPLDVLNRVIPVVQNRLSNRLYSFPPKRWALIWHRMKSIPSTHEELEALWGTESQDINSEQVIEIDLSVQRVPR
jgi:hypothetical protein